MGEWGVEKGNCDTSKCIEVNVSPTEIEIYKAVQGWLKSFLPSEVSIYKSQINRAPPPPGPFIQMLIVTRHRFATNSHVQNADQTATVTQPILMTVQLSVFREGAGDIASLISTLWRDGHATTYLSEHLPEITAVKATDPRQNVWINASAQYVDGWNLDLTIDARISTTIPSPSALDLHTAVIPADLLHVNKDNCHG